MRICYISNSAAPSKNASSLQTAKLCEAISKIGHKVNLILPNTGELDKNYFNFYNIKYKFKITRLNYFNKFPKGINYYLYSFFSILFSDYKKKDLFITRNFFTSFLLCFLKKKHVFEIHDDISIEGRLVKFLVKKLKILNNDSILKIITTTRSLKTRYIKYGVKKEKIVVLHNASSFKSKMKKYYLNPKKLNIGYFGSIYNSRGIEMIIRISEIDRKNDYFVYGGSKEQILDIKKNLKNKNIYFYPHIPYSMVYKKLLNIDVCILPYTSKITVSGNVGDISKYTSPLKLFDYMKLGKLILCSNLKVLNEVLHHKENCILINNYKDEKEWLKQINEISKNIKRYYKIRKSAFEYAKKYDVIWRTSKLLSF
tara:strand:+ start:20155 stop:21261 length:1107 start_codon:yes stop_codon:yes gene_type:complete